MKMVGGVLHGQDLPRALARMQFDRIEVLVTCGLGVEVVNYIRTEWFVGVGKPAIPFFVLEGAQIDDLIELARPVLSQC